MLIDTQKLREAVTKHYTKKANIISYKSFRIEEAEEINITLKDRVYIKFIPAFKSAKDVLSEINSYRFNFY